MSWLTLVNISFWKKLMLYYPIYNIFCAFGSSLISLTLLATLNPLSLSLSWRWNYFSHYHSWSHSCSQSSRSYCHSRTRFHFHCRSHCRGAKTNVSTISLGLTLAHDLGVTLMVCFSLKALWILCIFLLHCRKNFSIFFSLWVWLCWLLNMISSRWSWLNSVVTTTSTVTATTTTDGD